MCSVRCSGQEQDASSKKKRSSEALQLKLKFQNFNFLLRLVVFRVVVRICSDIDTQWPLVCPSDSTLTCCARSLKFSAEHFAELFEAGFEDREALIGLIEKAGNLRAPSHHARPFTTEDLRDLRTTWRLLEKGLAALDGHDDFFGDD